MRVDGWYGWRAGGSAGRLAPPCDRAGSGGDGRPVLTDALCASEKSPLESDLHGAQAAEKRQLSPPRKRGRFSQLCHNVEGLRDDPAKHAPSGRACASPPSRRAESAVHGLSSAAMIPHSPTQSKRGFWGVKFCGRVECGCAAVPKRSLEGGFAS